MTTAGNERSGDESTIGTEASLESPDTGSHQTGNEQGNDSTPASSSTETAAGQESDSEHSPLPLDAVFEILRNERRRTVLLYLQTHGGEVELGELAEHVAVEENDTTHQLLNSTERKRAYIGLYQCHLPKMDDFGVIEFNSDRGRIRPGPNIDQLTPYLDSPREDDSWPEYYLALALTNTTLFASWLAVGAVASPALSMAGAVGVCVLTIVSFAGLALAHYHHWQPDLPWRSAN